MSSTTVRCDGQLRHDMVPVQHRDESRAFLVAGLTTQRVRFLSRWLASAPTPRVSTLLCFRKRSPGSI